MEKDRSVSQKEKRLRSRRDDLVDAALQLFYTKGFNATAIDKILAEAGVAKMTLYKHFPSKEDLILAALTRRDEQFRDWLTSEMERASSDPREQLLAMFEALSVWFAGDAFKALGFNGSAFTNAASEYREQDHPIHRIAADHKKSIVEYLERLCHEAGAADPRKLAEQLALLKEGAIATAHVRGMPEASGTAREMAVHLIEKATGVEQAGRGT